MIINQKQFRKMESLYFFLSKLVGKKFHNHDFIGFQGK